MSKYCRPPQLHLLGTTDEGEADLGDRSPNRQDEQADDGGEEQGPEEGGGASGAVAGAVVL